MAFALLSVPLLSSGDAVQIHAAPLVDDYLMEAGDGEVASPLVARFPVDGEALLSGLVQEQVLRFSFQGQNVTLAFPAENHSDYVGDEGPFPVLLKTDTARVAFLEDDPTSIMGEFVLDDSLYGYQVQAAVDTSVVDELWFSVFALIDGGMGATEPNYPYALESDLAEIKAEYNDNVRSVKSTQNLKVRFLLKSGNYSPHNIYTIMSEMVDDINSRAFEQETDVSLSYDYRWRDYSSCGEDGSCFLNKIADAEGMPGGDRGDDITFYMYLVDGRIKYYDQAKEKWIWVVGLSKGPNPQDAYSTFPAEVVQYQYYSSASDTAYHTGKTAVHEMVHDLGHPGHDNGRRGCWACYKDYNLMYKSSSPGYGKVTYWFTTGTEETVNLVAPLAAQQH